MLSLSQLHALLDERLRRLTNGPRAPPRQQTLQTVIQWSYENLGRAEQRLARALSVCSGGCDLAAAAALLGDAGDDMAVPESLALLADQSLLTVEHAAHTARYLMLETVRQYALERLEDSGEAAAVRDRHRDHFMALAEEMGQQLSGPAPGTAMATLEPERDNLFRALAWCNGAEGARQGLRMVAALRYFWPSCGLLVRGYEVTREALARPGADQCGALRGRALSVASILCTWLGRDHDAIGHAEESLAVFERAGDDQGVARALSYIGAIKSDLGETDQASQHLERSLVVARRDGDEDVIANALNGLGNVLLRAGEVERAESVFEEVLALRRRLTQPAAEAVAWLNLAATAIEGRRPEAARQRLVHVWQLVQRVDSRFIGQVLVGMAAGVAALTEEAELALRLDAASKQQRIEIGLAPNIVGGEQARAFARAREALGAFTCASAEQAGREMHYAQTLAEVGAWLERTAQRS